MTLEEEKLIHKEFCKACGGKCCYGSCDDNIIPVSKIEADFITKYFPKVKIYQYFFSPLSSMLCFKVPKAGCPLLNKAGCSLNEEHKPLNCSCYPLVFAYKNKKLEFYWDESLTCPYIKKLEKLSDLKKNMIKDIQNKTSTWSKEELRFFTVLTKVTKKTNKKIKV